MFVIDCLRLIATVVGWIVLAMALLGATGVADFTLTFKVR